MKVKKLYNCLFAMAIMVYVIAISACAPVVVSYGLEAAGLAASALKSSNSSNKYVISGLVIGTQLESYTVGKYEIKMSDGFIKEKACFILAAYNNGTIDSAIAYEKDNQSDMKEIDDIKKVGGVEKKHLLKKAFLRWNNFDLGPVEEEESPKTATSYSPSFPTPGFAPKR